MGRILVSWLSFHFHLDVTKKHFINSLTFLPSSHDVSLPSPGITLSTRWTTRICGSCGIGPNTSWPSSRDACFSITTPSCACLRSTRWRRWLGSRSGMWRTTLPPRPTGTRLRVRVPAFSRDGCTATAKQSHVTHADRALAAVVASDQCHDGHFLSRVCLEALAWHSFRGNGQETRVLVKFGNKCSPVCAVGHKLQWMFRT